MATPELTPALFAILSALIEERLGLSYSSADQALLSSKLWARAEELGFDSLLDYYYFLRYDTQSEVEFEALTNALVVNETFFFREFKPLEVVVSHVLLPLVRAGARPRVWCAACSTGEEPLSLAMLLAEHEIASQVQLVASDVSTSALQRAQSGIHGRRSVRTIAAPGLAAKWLRVEDAAVRVDASLGAKIDWQQVNLLDRRAVDALGTFDVILCRNVLIYFRDPIVSRVVQQLNDHLRPDGVLLVGVSESLMRFGSGLECEEVGGAFLYRKAKL